MTYSHHPQLETRINEALVHLSRAGLLVVSGPSGTGKSHLIRQLHDYQEATSPLVFQEAAGLEEARFESQLFGHVKGAFSGAVRDYSGLLGAANGGSLCLEGIESLDERGQARMLRFLQERRYRAVGGTREREWHGRLLLTTCSSLSQLRQTGLLREDFYFRISVAELVLPLLSDRGQDRASIQIAMVAAIRKEVPMDLRVPSQAELAELENFVPEGNLHGLRNLLQQSMIRGLPPAELAKQEVPELAPGALPDRGSLKDDLFQLEHRLIQRALQGHFGSRQELAERLGISRRALMYKLKEHHLS